MDVTVHVAQNTYGLLKSVVSLVSEIKAGKAITQIVTDELPALVAAVGQVEGLASEIRSDIPGVVNAVVLGVSSVVSLFL